MEIAETGISSLLVITPKVFEDSRGYFFESYNADVFQNYGVNNIWVQDNQSKSA